jgi:phosphatidate cytidylyltransferase
MNNFFVRLFSGVIYISLIAGSILYNQYSFIIICSFLFFIANIECHRIWLKIRKKESYPVYPIPQLFVGISFLLLISIPYGGWAYNEIYNPYSILLIFVLIWISDTMSYVIGVQFGKNKIATKVSPNKTWEGFFGGLLFCLIFSILSFNYIQEIYPFWKTILLGLLIPIFAIIGDMTQSKLKRKAGVKNSGILIPGHGGVYDRLDSTIGVAPIAFIITMI